MRTLRFVLWGLVLVLAATTAGVTVGRMLSEDPQVAANSSIGAAFIRAGYADAGGPFTLLNTQGETVSEADFAGKPRAMFFGFTHCPDVCPTALLEAKMWLEDLGEDADDLAVLFVSVDPERDTPEVLERYVSAFDERIVALTPPGEDELADLAERYSVRYQKVPLREGDYTMNHTSDTLLFDAEGEYAGYIPFTPISARQDPALEAKAREAAVDTLRELVRS